MIRERQRFNNPIPETFVLVYGRRSGKVLQNWQLICFISLGKSYQRTHPENHCLMKHLLLLACLLSSVTAIYAQQSERYAPWFVERFKVSASFFAPSNNTDVKLSNTEFLGSEVNLEDDLGFRDHINTFKADVQWRASSRSRFDFSYYRLHRSAIHQLEKTIQFGENTYNVNGTTDGYFNSDIFRLSYGYAIFQGAKYEAGLMAGVHVLKMDMGLELTSAGANLDVKDTYDVTAPLPNVGIWGGYAFSPRWAVNGDLSYMSLSIDDINGSIVTGGVNVSYRIGAGFSASAGYMGLNVNFDGERDGMLGDVDWAFHGPVVSVSYGFGGKRWKTLK